MPDTADVKETFGTVIDTVLDQQNEILKLNEVLETSNKDHTEARRKLIDATNRSLQNLLNHQLMLENKLKDTQQKLHNFSYNMLGYADEAEAAELYVVQSASMIKNVSLDFGEQYTPDGLTKKGIELSLFDINFLILL